MTYTLKQKIAGIEAGNATLNLTIRAKDFAMASNTLFFGDRPLENPGYSDFSGKLSADGVNVGSTNRLDIFRVEQRLKYFGFPAMGTSNPNVSNNKLQDFTVDGKFGSEEQAALKLFEKVVRYGGKVTATGVSQNASISVNTAAGSATATINLKVSLDAQGAKFAIR